jgi:hypothetical protein
MPPFFLFGLLLFVVLPLEKKPFIFWVPLIFWAVYYGLDKRGQKIKISLVVLHISSANWKKHVLFSSSPINLGYRQ